MAANKAKEAQLLRKLSPRTIMEANIEVPKKHIPLYTVYGIATGVRSGDSAYGTWTALTGNFEAVRASDGQVFQGPQCFLPEPGLSMITSALDKGDTEGVQFALVIGVKPSAKEPDKKYEYTTQPVVKPENTGVLADLREQAHKALPAAH